MKLLEKVGLIGIGYILKDCGAFYPSSRRPSYNGYFNYSNPKKSPGEKIKNMLTEKLMTVMEKVIYGSEGTGYAVYAVPEMTFAYRHYAECALDDMQQIIDMYGDLSVCDYYNCCEGHDGRKDDGHCFTKYTDTCYGWHDIHDFRVVLNQDGMYIIKTTAPKEIEYESKPSCIEHSKTSSKK